MFRVLFLCGCLPTRRYSLAQEALIHRRSDLSMSDPKRDVTPKRRYPPVYERATPLALGVIVVLIVVLLLVVVVVLLGLFPGVGW